LSSNFVCASRITTEALLGDVTVDLHHRGMCIVFITSNNSLHQSKVITCSTLPDSYITTYHFRLLMLVLNCRHYHDAYSRSRRSPSPRRRTPSPSYRRYSRSPPRYVKIHHSWEIPSLMLWDCDLQKLC
jgi:hypothetical protein